MESGTTFDLERAITSWRKGYTSGSDVWPGELDELESHLRDRFEHLVDGGWPKGTAFMKAVDSIGTPTELAPAFRDNRYADTALGQSARLTARWFSPLFVNYFRTAARSLKRAGIYAVISSFGLAVALACCIWILIFAGNELGYDVYHEKADDIVRLTVGNTANTPELWAPAIEAGVPGVAEFVRIKNGAFEQVVFSSNDIVLPEKSGVFADASLFDVFSWSLELGDPQLALQKPFTMIISRDMIEKYGLPDNPIGSTIDIAGVSNTPSRRAYEITGVLAGNAGPSHIEFDYVLSMETILYLEEIGTWGTPFNWTNRVLKTYLLLEPAADLQIVRSEIERTLLSNIPDERYSLATMELQPLKSIHLESDKRSEFPGGGNLRYLYLLGGLALVVLILAMVNFVNLATARSVQRFKEVGMRKAIGASSSQIRTQYILESVVIAFVSLVGALLIAYWMRGFVQEMTLKDLSLMSLLQPLFAGSVILVTLLTGLAAGFYPAIVLSRYDTVDALKPGQSSGGHLSLLRKGMVAFQFCVSIGLVATTLLMDAQLRFVEERPLGYDSENVLVVQFGHSTAMGDNIETVVNGLRQDSRVQSVSASHSLPSNFLNTFPYFAEGSGPDEDVGLGNLALDAHLMSLLEFEIVAGRTFRPDSPADSMAFVINESAALALGWEPDESVIGKTLRWPLGSLGFSAPVIGLVKDFHYGSLHDQIQPISFNLSRFGSSYLLVKVRPESASVVIETLRNAWQTYEADFPFNYEWLDDRIENQYVDEVRMAELFSGTAILALIIACLGLFSMASYTTKNRTREIGIRKTLGAGTHKIVLSFAWEFGALLLAALIAAIPLTIVSTNSWLNSFAYRIDVGAVPFVLAAAVVALVAVVSVATQTYRAATANPTISLRSQ